MLAERLRAAPGQAFWVADRDAYPLASGGPVRRALDEEGLRARDAVSGFRERWRPRRSGPTGSCSGAAATSPRSMYWESWRKTIRCDISRTVEVLGYEPRVGLLEGMRRSLSWCVSQGVDIAPPAQTGAPA